MYNLKDNIYNLDEIGKLQLATQLCQEALEELLKYEEPRFSDLDSGKLRPVNDVAVLVGIQFDLWTLVQRLQDEKG